MKKIIALLISIVCLFSTSACTSTRNGDIPDNVTVIKVDNFTGGIGVEWLRKAARRFEEANAETVFEEGKQGVYVDISTVQPDPATISTSGYHIFFDERYSNIYDLAQTGKIVNINDIVTGKDKDGNVLSEYMDGDKSLESRIYASVREGLKWSDGEYYAVPHYEWFPGLIYDREAFDYYNWYFAKDAANGKQVGNPATYGTAYFVKNASSEKSCGPDGIYGNDDDGLPSSLKEMIILCSVINEYTRPFTLTGMYPYYATYLLQGLWAALAGKEELRALYDMTGTVNVVTGYTNELLFPGTKSTAKKPTVEAVSINKDNGYLAYKSAARYYATAFIDVITKEGWVSNEATMPNMSHVETQKSFIYGGLNSQNPRRAFLIEGSYWYNESVASNNFSEYFALARDKEERDVRFMPLPTTLDTPVTEENGKPSLIDDGLAYAYINARFKNNKAIIEACKAFLSFVYSDAELREFTALTGITRPIDYTLSPSERERLSPYQQSVYDLARSADVFYYSSDNELFKRNQTTLKVSLGSDMFKPTQGNIQYVSHYVIFKDTSVTVDSVFDLAFTKSEWESIIGG